jgi:regulator of protease activity HflC (stomatin/prohibitin superfamily)
MLLILQIIAAATLLGGLLGIAWRVSWWRLQIAQERKQLKRSALYGGSAPESQEAPKFPSLKLPAVVFVLGLLLCIVFLGGGAAQVSPTSIGVIENAWYGTMYPLQPGTHIWPFSRNLTPLITRVTVYDARNQIIEIGEPPAGAKVPAGLTATQAFGVPSASDSPGQPIVYFRARGWARLNPDTIVELHRRYGASYLTNWVEQNWVTTLKAVQGRHAYDYLKNQRTVLENEVESLLQEQLSGLVIVSQLAIADYDYEQKVNAFLQDVAAKEFERQKQEQQIAINVKTQEAEKISVETKYIVTKRTAEAEQAKLIAEAKGRADATMLEADATAYQKKAIYQATADGIRLVSMSLTDEYLRYQATDKWSGSLPTVWLGGEAGALPILNIPMPQ